MAAVAVYNHQSVKIAKSLPIPGLQARLRFQQTTNSTKNPQPIGSSLPVVRLSSEVRTNVPPFGIWTRALTDVPTIFASITVPYPTDYEINFGDADLIISSSVRLPKKMTEAEKAAEIEKISKVYTFVRSYFSTSFEPNTTFMNVYNATHYEFNHLSEKQFCVNRQPTNRYFDDIILVPESGANSTETTPRNKKIKERDWTKAVRLCIQVTRSDEETSTTPEAVTAEIKKTRHKFQAQLGVFSADVMNPPRPPAGCCTIL